MINPVLHLGSEGKIRATFLVQCQSNDEIERARQYFSSFPWVNVIATCSSGLPDITQRAKRLSVPMEVFNSMDEQYYIALENELKTQKYDLIQVEHSWMSWVVPLIRLLAPETPVALDMLDIEGKRLERWLEYDKYCDRKEITSKLVKMRRWEGETWQWYDGCLAVSDIEAQEYCQATGNRIQAFSLPVSGGTPMEKPLTPASRKKIKPQSMVNIGTLIWYPNVHGLIWFIDKVMPLIKANQPVATLHIAGFGGLWQELMELIRGRKEIIFMGEIADEREILDIGQVFIAPIFIATGARIKILTAWAAGIPVVATSIAAEGLHYTNMQDIMIADTPQGFADAICNLFDDTSLTARLIDNGRQTVEKYYSPECAASQYASAYDVIIQTFKARSKDLSQTEIWVKRERKMQSLVKLKTNLQEEVSCSNQIHKLPLLTRKSMSFLDKSLPAFVKKTSLYSLGLAAIILIDRRGWLSFFESADSWLQQHWKEGMGKVGR